MPLNKSIKKGIYQWRFYSVIVVLSTLVAAILWRLVNIQILPGEDRGFEFLQSQLGTLLKECLWAFEWSCMRLLEPGWRGSASLNRYNPEWLAMTLGWS